MVDFENPFKKDEKKEEKKKKTVGDMLKEQGIIKPLPQKKTEKPVEPKTKSDSKILMDIEKLRAEIQMLKDAKSVLDDRIRDMTEKMGEFRSLIFQRESLIKEMESKIRLQEEEIFNIKPRIIQKEMDLVKKEIEENRIGMEKLETMNKDILKDVKHSKEILDNIKSIDNIQKMLDDTRKKVEEIEKSKNDVDRLAGRTEKFYIEMSERMKDFVNIKAKTSSLDEMSREMAKTIDSVNIRLGSFAPRDDLENFKNTINDIVVKSREKNQQRLAELEEYIKIPETETKKKIDELKEKSATVSKLLDDLEQKHKKAEITEKTYNETKEKNENLLKEIAEQINETKEEESFEMKSLPATIKDLKTRIGKMESLNSTLMQELSSHRKFLGDNVREMNEKIDKSTPEGSYTEEYKGAMQTQTQIMKSTLEAIKKLNQKMNNISEDVSLFDLRIRFFETLSMLIRVQRKREIQFYMSELEKVIAEMKAKKIWDNTRKNVVLGLLGDISFNWKEYGYDDFAAIFDQEMVKFRPAK